MCRICISQYVGLQGLQGLDINNCQNITTIPIINGLQILNITNCQNIKKIPIIEGLQELNINNCQNITTIPIIGGLKRVSIINCQNITTIPIIERLKELYIRNCNINYYNYGSIYSIKQFCNINTIKKWYRKKLLYIKYKTCIHQMEELSIQYQMDPYRKNNKYLEEYIKENVYYE
mgnify:CR=1 FL=1